MDLKKGNRVVLSPAKYDTRGFTVPFPDGTKVTWSAFNQTSAVELAVNDDGTATVDAVEAGYAVVRTYVVYPDNSIATGDTLITVLDDDNERLNIAPGVVSETPVETPAPRLVADPEVVKLDDKTVDPEGVNDADGVKE